MSDKHNFSRAASIYLSQKAPEATNQQMDGLPEQ